MQLRCHQCQSSYLKQKDFFQTICRHLCNLWPIFSTSRRFKSRSTIKKPLAGLREALDPAGLARVEKLGLAERDDETLALTERGRFLGGGVTAELLAG